MTSPDRERVDRLVRSFDHWAPELAVDPQSVYQALRDQCPVARSDKYGGFWVLSRYEDIEAAARDAATFSSTSVSIPLEIGMGGLPIPPLDQDPPEHTRFRQQLLPFFSPARTLSLEPLTRRVAAELIDGFKDAGGCDVAAAFARPVPIAVLAQILGIDPKDHKLFTAWTTAIIEDAAADADKAAQAGAELYTYFGEKGYPSESTYAGQLAVRHGWTTRGRSRLGGWPRSDGGIGGAFFEAGLATSWR